MKKGLLFLLLVSSCTTVFGQYSIFMQIIENKKICNKEDELTYFLQAHSFERQNLNHYYHHYAMSGNFYYTLIINDNECYVTYRTDNSKDYNKIKSEITRTCVKELAADKSVSYVCNTKRVRDVQIIFPGYSQKDKYYEILVYQNPEQHEPPYNQANRIMPDEEQAPVAKKVKKRTYKKTEVKTETTKTVTPAAVKTSATPAPVTKPTPTPAVKTAAPPIIPKVAAPPAIKMPTATMKSAPAVIKK